MTLGSHQSTIGKSDNRFTPVAIWQPVGPFDSDMATSDVRPWSIGTKHNITPREDALSLDWREYGRLWLNPPFNRYGISAFVGKMCEANCGIMLVHVRTETEWFKPIWHYASALRFLAGRYIFHNPDGSLCVIENPKSKHYGKPANSGAPLVLASFGANDADVLCLCGIDGYFVPLIIPKSVLMKAYEPSWRDAVLGWLKEQQGPISVADLYRAFAEHPKSKRNRNWRPKLRQTLLRGAGKRVARDQWIAP